MGRRPRVTLIAAVDAALARGQGSEYLPAVDAAVDDHRLSQYDKASLLLLRCRIHRQGLDYPSMLRDATEAADMYRDLGEPALEARAVATAAIAAAECGDVLVGADLAVRARVTSIGVGGDDPSVLNRIGMFCHRLYDLPAAVEWWEEGLAVARRAQDEVTELLVVHNIVETTYTAYRLGELGGRNGPDVLAAAESFAHWLAGELDDTSRRVPVDGPRLLALILAVQGRVDGALGALDEAQRDMTPRTSSVVRSSYDAAEGYCLLTANRPEEALAALDRALEPRSPDALDTDTLLARIDRAAALEVLGHADAALTEERRVTGMLVARLRQQGRGVLREVDLRSHHEVKQAQLLHEADALARDARRDPLTGAGNRRMLRVLIDEMTTQPAVGVVAVDLDRFKAVNDRHGHAVGDDVLVRTVELLDAVSGSVSDDATVVRLGGEEFVVVCPGSDRASVTDIGEAVRVAVESHDWSEVRSGLSVTVSVGAASGAGGVLPDTLQLADAALMLAKRQGRNRVRTAGDAPEPDVADTRDTLVSLEEAGAGRVRRLPESILVRVPDDSRLPVTG